MVLLVQPCPVEMCCDVRWTLEKGRKRGQFQEGCGGLFLLKSAACSFSNQLFEGRGMSGCAPPPKGPMAAVAQKIRCFN